MLDPYSIKGEKMEINAVHHAAIAEHPQGLSGRLEAVLLNPAAWRSFFFSPLLVALVVLVICDTYI